MRTRATRAATLAATTLVAAFAVGGVASAGAGTGSGSDSGIADADLSGTTVTLFGVEGDAEGEAMQAALDVFAEEHDMTIVYTGSRGFEGEVGTQIEGGSPPDIGLFPQPGRIATYAASGNALALPDDVLAAVSANWGDGWMVNGNVDGTQYGVPLKSDLKSLVWYVPSTFAEYGYEVPETLDAFVALVEQVAADGEILPLCVGIGSDDATGWPFTDWVEELVLRNQGIEFYNQWVTGEVPFNSPEVVEAFEQVGALWADDNVWAEGGSIASTFFGDNGAPLVNGDCLMHRQASFFAAFMPEGTEFGEGEGQVSAFYFPANEGTPVLGGGINAAAFRDAPEVWAVMQYLGSPEFANARQAAQSGDSAVSGFLTGVQGVDPAVWSELELTFLGILEEANPVAFDASDLMPSEVGSRAFFDEATAFVNGEVTAQEAADNIQAAWPAD